MPPLTALNGEKVTELNEPKTVEALETPPETAEPAKETVVEIHINK